MGEIIPRNRAQPALRKLQILTEMPALILKRARGPVLIWPNMTIAENVFQEILPLTKIQHVVSSKRVTEQKKISN